MYLTKIEVLIAHDHDPNVDEALVQAIDSAVGQHLEENRMGGIYEVRPWPTQEVTLGAIDWSLEQREALEPLKRK